MNSNRRRPFVIPVHDLLTKAVLTKRFDTSGPVAPIFNEASALRPGVDVEISVSIAATGDCDLLATGVVSFEFEAQCSRCLRQIKDRLASDFEEAVAGNETQRTDGGLWVENDAVDFLSLVNELVALELPFAPLCDPDCRGICSQCGVDLNQESCDCSTEHIDPRWDALSALTFEDSSEA